MASSRDKNKALGFDSRRGMFLSISLASGGILLFVLQEMTTPFLSTSHFAVEEIEAHWPQEMKLPVERYRLTPPTSIFRVDLAAVSQALQKVHPGVEVEAVRRVLPNRLVATLRPLKVVAQLRTDRYYLISEEGIIVGYGQTAPWLHVPILIPEGLRGPFRVGQVCTHPAFWQAAELLAAIHRQGGINGHGVSVIRSSAEQLVVFLDTGLEIRFSSHRLWAGWEDLVELLIQKRDLVETARYIDLRFENPVIGGQPRPTKKR